MRFWIYIAVAFLIGGFLGKRGTLDSVFGLVGQ